MRPRLHPVSYGTAYIWEICMIGAMDPRWLNYLPILIPIISLLIPIVVLLTKHQQKMAEIVHKSSDDKSEISQLRQELSAVAERLRSGVPQ